MRYVSAMLDSIEIEGYRSIAKARVELKRLNVLIGANGSGKSNFVGVFKTVRQIVDQRLQESVLTAGGAERWLRHGQKQTAEIRFKIHFILNAYEVRLAPSDDGSLIIREENAFFDRVWYGGPHKRPTGTASRESALREIAAQVRNTGHVLSGVLSWKVFHFHDTSRTAAVKQTCAVDDNITLREDGANLAAVLFRIRTTDPTGYQRILRSIQQVAPFFEDFTLQPSRLNSNVIKLEWKERGSDLYLDGHSLSDGTLRFICMATMLHQPEPPEVIVIDEPELGLHPFAITVLANLFRSVATERSVQIVAATQSTAFVNQLSPEEIIVVDRDQQNGSTFRRPTEQEISTWLDEYGLGDLWEKNVIGGRPR